MSRRQLSTKNIRARPLLVATQCRFPTDGTSHRGPGGPTEPRANSPLLPGQGAGVKFGRDVCIGTACNGVSEKNCQLRWPLQSF